MTEREYRQDDRNEGYCPVCAKPLTGLTVAARGYCEQHGWVWAEWTPREERGMEITTVVETSITGHVLLRVGESDAREFHQTDLIAMSRDQTLDLIDRLQGALRFMELDVQKRKAHVYTGGI